MEILSAEWRAKQQGLWERAVLETPGIAYQFGCPSWKAEWDGKEEFGAAFLRVRDRYFPDGDPRNVPTQAVGTSVTVGTISGDKFCACGRVVEPRRKIGRAHV